MGLVSKHNHEIRDPIHVFVHLDSDERKVLDSRPFQRLRHIHQLAMTYLLYPAATHKRFEHSLGVMELAGRVFDVVTHPDHVTEEIKKAIPELCQEDKLRYWRRVLRMAALCHDMGHLPFSHAAEVDLLPAGWDHERITCDIIMSPIMDAIWNEMTPPLRARDLVKLAVGPRKALDESFTIWEAILSEIIVGDAFGVDRMDYLLRDSYHAGVTYGRFDHYRLIDTLRILFGEENIPSLGVEAGGLHSAEALLLARYHMYSQVYFHPIRRIYDIHLKDFLKEWLPDGRFPTDPEDHLLRTDNEVLCGILEASRDPSKPGHEAARRIAEHDHFKVLYQRNPEDVRKNPDAGIAIFDAARTKFGENYVRWDEYKQRRNVSNFPVLLKDGRNSPASDLSETLQHLPIVSINYVFIDSIKLEEARGWLNEERDTLIQPRDIEEISHEST